MRPYCHIKHLVLSRDPYWGGRDPGYVPSSGWRYLTITCYRLVVIKEPRVVVCRSPPLVLRAEHFIPHTTYLRTMSILSSFKRVSISSTKVSVQWGVAKSLSQSYRPHYQSAKSSNCSVPVNGNPAPQGITSTFELVSRTHLSKCPALTIWQNIQSSSPVVSCASPTSGCVSMVSSGRYPFDI